MNDACDCCDCYHTGINIDKKVAAPVTGPRGWLSFQARFHSVIPKLRVFVHFHLQAQQVDPYFVLQRSWIRSSFVSFATAKYEFLAWRLKNKLWVDRMSCVFSGEMVFRAITVAVTILFSHRFGIIARPPGHKACPATSAHPFHHDGGATTKGVYTCVEVLP